VAEAGEVAVSDAVYTSPRVRDVLSTAGLVVKKQQVPLKGVSDDFTVFRLTPALSVDKVQAVV
jgi:class 3 adenylate cyclase